MRTFYSLNCPTIHFHTIGLRTMFAKQLVDDGNLTALSVSMHALLKDGKASGLKCVKI
jgi:hypothetical protein